MGGFDARWPLGRLGFATCVLLAAWLGQAVAQAVWNGSTSANWFDGANWNGGAAPTALDPVTIDVVAPNGTVFNAPGSSIDIQSLLVGRLAQGSLEISEGELKVADYGAIGSLPGANGSVRVRGANSTFDVNNGLYVGELGVGTLTVEGGARLQNEAAVLGYFAGGVGFATVSGAGSMWFNEDNLTIGQNGEGHLTVADSGQVLTNNSSTIGRQLGSLGQVTVTGAGSSWLTDNELLVGSQGTGRLSLENGGVAVSLTAVVGAQSTSTGFVRVDGSGSAWAVTEGIGLGFAGAGELEITNGGKVTADYLFSGSENRASGRIFVSGAGSLLETAHGIGLGYGGAGSLTVADGAVVRSTGEETIIGVAVGSGGAAIVTGAGSLWQNSALLVGNFGNGTVTVTDGGRIALASVLDIAVKPGSSGVLNIGADKGETAMAPGFVDAALGIEFGDGTGEINFNHTASNYLFSQSIVGNGLINVLAGRTVLTSDASLFTGETVVLGGALSVDSKLGGTLLVGTAGRLEGGGQVGSVTVAGTVAPGNSIGTLNVAGNIAFDPGSTYAVETNAAGQSDRIAVTGTATLAGGTVSISGPLQLGHRYTILTAGGGVAGTFAGLSAATSSPFLAPALAYDPNSAYLDVVRSGLAFASVGQTPNQIATASALDGMSLDNPLIGAVASLSIDQARSAFDGLSGEVHASTVTALIEDSRLIRAAMNDRLRSAFETVGAAPLPLMGYDEAAGGNAALEATASIASASPATASAAERYGVWGSAFGSWGWTDSDGNAAKLSRSTGGFVTGIDGLVTDDWRLGFLAGYSHSSFKVDDRRSSASSDNYHLGAYGGTQWGALSLRSGLAYTWSDIDSGRSVSFPGFTDALSSSYRTGTTQIFGELGYGMKAGNLAFEPFANLAYVNVHTNAFSEKGGAAALTVRSSSNAITFTTFGLRASTDFDLGAVKATARGMIGWRHGFGDVTPNVTQAFAGSNAFTIAGAPIARESAALEAGFDVALTPTTTLGISYQGQLAANARDHGVRADLNVRF
ncbi:autotransporter domain-containing protein [Mesorhizobium terrae]